MAALTDKQKLFIDLYISSLDARQAYIEAFGVGMGTAKTNGYRLLEKPEVREAIDRKLQEIKKANPRILSAEEVLENLTKEAMDENNNTRDKLKAMELLGKYHALFTERIQQESTVNIVVDIEEEEE